MAASEIIASGTTAASSSDFTVVAGTPVTVFLKDAAGAVVDQYARALIQIKDTAGEYFTVGVLTGYEPALIIDGPGDYRVTRELATVAFGVNKS